MDHLNRLAQVRNLVNQSHLLKGTLNTFEPSTSIAIFGNCHVAKSSLFKSLTNTSSTVDTWNGKFVTVPFKSLSITDSPGFGLFNPDNQKVYHNFASNADLIILKTTNQHLLKSKQEVDFLERYKEKPTIIVNFDSPEMEVGFNRSRIISSCNNIESLSSKLESLANDNTQLKVDKIAFLVRDKLSDYKNDISAVTDFISDVDDNLKSKLADLKIQKGEIYDSFDLQTLDSSFSKISQSLKLFFSRISLLKLFTISSSLKSKLDINVIKLDQSVIESSIYYQVGKINSRIEKLYSDLRSDLFTISSNFSKSVDSLHSTQIVSSSQEFQLEHQFSRLDAFLNPALVDPARVSEGIKKLSINDLFATLQKKVHRLVYATTLSIFGIAATGFLSTFIGLHAGLATVVSMAGYVTLYGIIAYRWRSYQNEVLDSISTIHKTSSEKILNVFNQERCSFKSSR